MKRTNRSRQMSHSDRRFDKKFQFSRQRGRIVKWFSPMEVLFFEIEEIVEHPLTACNLDCLAAQLVDRYGGAEQAIAALRSGKMKFEEVSSGTGADDTGLQITLLSPYENEKNVLLGFFVDPEDDDSLLEFMDSLAYIYCEDCEHIFIEILGTSAFDRAYDQFIADASRPGSHG
jgi:hypothetical protein